MITVSAFRWVPTFARGLVRDLRVRWALEEAGLPYKAWLIGPDDQKSERSRAMQPFGQVPAYEEDDLVLFESGAILLHIADRGPDAVGLKSTRPSNGLDVRGTEFDRTAHSEPHGDRLVSCRGGLGKKTPASGCQIRTNASGRALRLARQSRLSGGSFHRGGPSDDDRAANSAAY